VVIVWKRRDREARRAIAAVDDHHGADFHRVRMVGMDLRGKDFTGANLEWADLTEADLRGTRLANANLHGAYLVGTQLAGANLSGACLDDSYLLAADFGRAFVAGATFEGAIWDQSTTWPPGATPPQGDVGLWHGRRRGLPKPT
jgi:uncharacterized protein YjbI with pentapeptide repeats